MGNNWELEDTDAIYFWGGVFSNWAKFEFHARLRENGQLTNFNCAEQYMMATKAVLFEDQEALWDVMHSSNPKTQKAIGRAIVGYSDDEWNPVARDYTYPGIYEKFRQNDKARDLLVSTGNKLLVEASPFDRKWGVGFDHLNAPENRDRWGWNWLGHMLMKARDDIRTGEDSSFTPIDWSVYESWHKK